MRTLQLTLVWICASIPLVARAQAQIVVEAGPGALPPFEILDANGDGSISRQEFDRFRDAAAGQRSTSETSKSAPSPSTPPSVHVVGGPFGMGGLDIGEDPLWQELNARLVEADVDKATLAKVEKAFRDTVSSGFAFGPLGHCAHGEPGFMIGVHCEEIADGGGLRIVSVLEESPAVVAGLKEGDVLAGIDGEMPVRVEDLVRAIQRAGEEERRLECTVVRGGQEQKIVLEPQRRAPVGLSGLEIVAFEDADGTPIVIGELPTFDTGLPPWLAEQVVPVEGDDVHGWQAIGPGFVVPPTADDSGLRKDVRELREQVDRLEAMMQQLLEARSKEAAKPAAGAR